MYIYNTAEAKKRDRVGVAVEDGALEASRYYYDHYAHTYIYMYIYNTAEAKKRDRVGVSVEDGALKASTAAAAALRHLLHQRRARQPLVGVLPHVPPREESAGGREQ